MDLTDFEANKEKYRAAQHEALREPAAVITGTYPAAGISDEMLFPEYDLTFGQILAKLNITLLASREYEHLLIGLSGSFEGRINQSFIHLPHPCGIAYHPKSQTVYVAGTRNPNQIIEFKPVSSFQKRTDLFTDLKDAPNYLVPTRMKFLPGLSYLHDLAFIGEELYGDSVGQNGIMKVDMNSPNPDPIIWTPKSMQKDGEFQTDANYIQLNSIAAGKDFDSSFFTASGAEKLSVRPGSLDYPVDKQGVVFSGKTGEVVGRGLTRPHSARLYQNEVYIANSGYGTLVKMTNGQPETIAQFKGWTRGLCFCGSYAFVGVSRVMPKFSVYAPGLDPKEYTHCGIFAVNMNTLEVEAKLEWKYGNQLFALEAIPAQVSTGFPFQHTQPASNDIMGMFYKYDL